MMIIIMVHLPPVAKAFTLAPFDNNNCTTSKWPRWAAKWRAVAPKSDDALISIPGVDISSLTDSILL